jgi:hypothetical protein
MPKVYNEEDRRVEVDPKGMMSCKGGLDGKLLYILEYLSNIVIEG